MVGAGDTVGAADVVDEVGTADVVDAVGAVDVADVVGTADGADMAVTLVRSRGAWGGEKEAYIVL